MSAPVVRERFAEVQVLHQAWCPWRLQDSDQDVCTLVFIFRCTTTQDFTETGWSMTVSEPKNNLSLLYVITIDRKQFITDVEMASRLGKHLPLITDRNVIDRLLV